MRTARRRSCSDHYHVIARGTGRQLIFEDDSDRVLFLKILKNALSETGCSVLAWCLMGNHIHLLVNAELESVAELMRRLCGTYAQAFNARHDRVGHLFQERYKSEPVEDDEYLLTVIRYIHANPQKAGISPMESYQWSSYREYIRGETPLSICATASILEMLDGIDGFIAFHKAADSEDDARCLEIGGQRSQTRPMGDSVALLMARTAVGMDNLASIKALAKPARNEALAKMKRAGLTIRQIERFTGIGRGVIQSIAK